ncbi:MAG: NADH-quinone oxidoreductase subunit H [Holosporales bacterium]|jgi:NADH-quinone oxidoreductase subunit H|nr:NADH-quinone oxidoreductase subunit H [Holosporales bacterium]
MNFILKSFIFFVGYITFAAYVSLLERKLIGRVQLRLGPNKCGPLGLFQPIADALKLLFKRDSLKNHSKQSIFGVCLMFFIALFQLTLIPLAKDIYVLNLEYSLFMPMFFHAVFAFSEITIGMRSKSKYGVIGGVRGYIQLLGSHIPFILILTNIALYTKSLNILDIIETQNKLPLIVPLFPLFIVFFITSLIIANKTPFDFLEAESEIVSGIYVEYGGILFAMIYLSDYLNLIFISSFISALFLGGYQPILGITFLPPIVNSIIKPIIVMSFIILLRAILPRYKQEQMILISWGILSLTALAYLIVLI